MPKFLIEFQETDIKGKIYKTQREKEYPSMKVAINKISDELKDRDEDCVLIINMENKKRVRILNDTKQIQQTPEAKTAAKITKIK